MGDKRNPAPIVVIQGAQYGSEAKGMVAAAITEKRGIDICVRTGAINAGHTVYYKGNPYKMQQLPTGWVRPEAQLVLGAGAYIDVEVLQREINIINAAMPEQDVRKRLDIDIGAGLHHPYHQLKSTDSGRHHTIGATGKGCSESIIERLQARGRTTGNPVLFRDFMETRPEGILDGVTMCDTARLLNSAYDGGAKILIEGTQGTMLDLYFGPYPYTTHKQTLAGQWITECGFSPALDYEVVLCVRTYPIRVAGNSGPLPNEISWSSLARNINYKFMKAGKPPIIRDGTLEKWNRAINYARLHASYPVPSLEPETLLGEDRTQYREYLSEIHRDAWYARDGAESLLNDADRAELCKLFEFTTVTHKLRRIGMLDIPTVKRAVMFNRPSSVCVTFFNYVFPDLWGATEMPTNVDSREQMYIDQLSRHIGADIDSITTGPETPHYINR